MKRSPLKRNTGESRATIKAARCKAPRCLGVALPYRPFCSADCGAVLGLAAVEKAKRLGVKREKALDRIKREDMKTLPDLLKETQREFNSFIRRRDVGQLCIDGCGVRLLPGAVGGGFDCGHFRSVGSAPHLRFDERNAHGQAKKCNQWLGGRAIDYRAGLVVRMGVGFVESLEADQTPRKYTRDQLRDLRDHYRAKVREMKNETK